MIAVVAQWATTRFQSARHQHGVLFKNSTALALGTGMSGMLGFVYWWLAARSFSAEVIGTASALISLMGFIGLIGEFGIGTLLTGEIIQRQPEHRHGLISAAMITSFVLSSGVGGVVLLFSKLVAGHLTALDPSMTDYLWVMAGCGLTGMCLIIDKAFVGLLQSGFNTLRNFLFSVFKLGMILVLARQLSSEAAILSSWVISMIVALIPVELLMRCTCARSLVHLPDFKLLYMLRDKAIGHYMLDLSAQAQVLIMPYLVAVLLSPTSNAVFTVTWYIVLIAAIIPGALSSVLFSSMRAAPEQYRDKMVFSLALSCLFAFLFGLFIFFYSSELLTIFNPDYAKIGGSHLRFLGFGIIGHAIKSHVGAAARFNNRMRQSAVLFGIAGIFEIVCVIIGCRVGGLEGVSVSWTSALLLSAGLMFAITNPFVARS